MINNINLTVDEAESVEFGFDDGEEHGLDIDAKIVIVQGDSYTGPYTVTPNSQTQTLSTADLVMTNNVTVNPIPSNYGLITWNGSVLTVS